MVDEFDRQALVKVFLAEASEGLGTLGAAFQPNQDVLPAPEAVRAEYIVAHRLRGSASLYGFTGVTQLAEALEIFLEEACAVAPADWPGAVERARSLLGALHSQIDVIGRLGVEEDGCFDRWKALYPSEAGGPQAPDAETPADEPLPDRYLLPDADPEVFSYFSPEASEYLDAIEAALLLLEKTPDDAGTVQQLFRAAHTLKGSAYTVGFQAVGDLTHYVEDLMDMVRDGRRRMTPALADLIFRAVDVVRLLMRRDPDGLADLRKAFAAVMAKVKNIQAEAGSEPSQAVPAVSLRDASPGRETAAEASAAQEGERKPAAVEGGAVIRVSRERLERLLNLVGELVIGRGRLEQRLKTLEQLSYQVQACKGRMLDTIRTFEEEHAFTLPARSMESGRPAVTQPVILHGFGGLEFDKYDDFNILSRRIAEVAADIGESMSQLSASIRKAHEDMSQLRRLTLGMQDEIAGARMVPIGTPFTRFHRAAREMARVTGKEVTLAVSGEHTEVDTVVVERLVDPLIHLVRNAIHHGIEPPAVRRDQGKPPIGTVHLHAAHRGNAVVIEVEDDGQGLDFEKIKAKAVALGILRPELAATLPVSETIKVIFLPGFSTAEGVGDQAGRGVGLDVVKRGIESMHGHLEVETEQGLGTKFTLTLPLTLLISTVLMVRVGNERYAIPLSSIREVVMPKPGSIQDIGGRSVLRVGEEMVEVRAFSQVLGGIATADVESSPIVVVRTVAGLLGLTVEELLGRHETVVKSLGTLKPLQQSCFGGATIDPEGRVVLVLDPARLQAARADGQVLAAPSSVLPLPSASRSPDALSVEEQGASARILLIDDSLSVRKFVGRMLESAGFEVDTAVDGEEGLRKASAKSYRLIITDLEMPKLNGYEVIQALRARPQTKSTPVLVMTTRAAEKHRQMALSMGASGYLAKPVEERTLVREIGHWVGQAAGTRA